MNQPENISIKFESLIHRIEQGDIKIPQFQREFVWSKAKSAKLLDSILKGYPVGSFTMWETKERLRTIRNIGGAELPVTREGYATDYVLDGQQRMTSLFAAFKGIRIKKDNREEDFSEIYIDLMAEESDDIVIIDVEGRHPEEIIKLKDLLFGGRKLLRLYPEEMDDKLEDYKNRFITYLFSVISIKDAPIDVATEVFSRLNVGGEPLSVFEIMVAKMYDEESGFDLMEKTDEFLCRMKEYGYETIPKTTILQIVSIILVKECSKKQILNLKRKEFISMWDDIMDATENAIEYFKHYYRIPVSRLLPYNALLVPFAYFFYHNKVKPEGSMRLYMDDFFWRTSISGRYSRSLEGMIAQDIKRIDKILADDIPRYDYEVNIEPEHIIEHGHFSVGRSFIKAILCLYAYQEPKSFMDNSKVTMDNDWLKIANSKNYHHFFPKKFMEGKKDDFYVNHILNITIVDDYLNKRKIKTKAPSVYISEFIAQNDEIVETMKTHLIDIYNDGVLTDNYDKFIQKRAEAVSIELKKRIIKKSIMKVK